MERFTLSEVCQALGGISRQALHKQLKKAGIQAEREGNRAYLSGEQLEQLKTGTTSTVNQPSMSINRQRKVDIYTDTVDILKQQVVFLQEQLGQERSEKTELLKQNSNYQAMLMAFQQRNQQLETENHKLLEAPPVAVNHDRDSVGFVGRVLERVKQGKKKKKRK